MKDLLIKYLKEETLLDDSSIDAIVSHFSLVKKKRNELLEAEGGICRNFYFINKGGLRLYEIDKKGNEITAYFSFEKSFITALTSFITQKPSRDCLICLEPSELLKISRPIFLKLLDKYPKFKALYYQLIEFALIHSQMRIYSFLGMEGIDKLRWVIEHEPKLLSRIPGKAVASYLGMTSSTLSKLRAKL